MGGRTVLALRVVLVLALAGSLVVQLVLMPLVWIDLDVEPAGLRVTLVAIGVFGVACLQVIAVCVWRLLTMVRRGTVFSHAAFRYVDTVIGAIATGSLLVFAVAVTARFANHSTPGDEVAPGLVALICGFALVGFGFALLVHVLRTLLAQAVALESETRHLQAELDEVI